MADYVPGNDVEFKDFVDNLVLVLSPRAGELDLTPEDIAPLGAGKTAFGTALTDHMAKRQAAKAATTVKNTTRAPLEANVRAMVRRIDGHPGLTDELRADLRLPPRDVARTPGSVGPDVPILILESEVGRVIVHFGISPENERTNTTPSWVRDVKIFRRKSGESGFTMIDAAKTSPYYDVITGPAADYTYYVQYRGTKPTDLGAISPEETVAARGVVAA